MTTQHPTMLYPITKSSARRTASLIAIVPLLLLFGLASIGFAQSPSNIFVTGATPANNTTTGYDNNYSIVYASQTNTNGQAYNSGTASAPDYCQTPANQSRPECQSTVVNNTYNPNTTTYSTTGTPSYCTNPANANRPECQAGYNTTQTQITQTQPTQTTGQVPSYCQTAANQSRPECQVAQTQTSSSYPSYCYQSQYSTRSECQGLYTVTPVVQTPVTQTVPNYCSFPEYQFRPECQPQSNPVTILNPTTQNPTTQYPAYCANPANQFLVACQPTNTITTPTSTSYPTYCQTPANQSRPECQGSVTTTVPTTPTQPACQPGIYIPNCVTVTVPRPCIAGIYDPLCTPTTTVPTVPTTPTVVTVPPAPIAPVNCPTGTGGENCVDSGDFALPVPPAPLSCQQNAANNPQAIRDFCSAIYFTHAGAYANGSAVATLRRFQQFSFLMRSPYAGHAYIFSRAIDGSIQALLPNQQLPQAVDIKLYQQVHIPTDVNTFGTNYSFTTNSPITEIFYVVLTEPAPTNTFANVRNDIELQNTLLNLGLVNGIYHGIAGSPVQTIN